MMATPGAKFLSKKLYLESINVIVDFKVKNIKEKNEKNFNQAIKIFNN